MTPVSKVPQGNEDNLWHLSLTNCGSNANYRGRYEYKSLYNSYLEERPVQQPELAVGLL